MILNSQKDRSLWRKMRRLPCQQELCNYTPSLKVNVINPNLTAKFVKLIEPPNWWVWHGREFHKHSQLSWSWSNQVHALPRRAPRPVTRQDWTLTKTACNVPWLIVCNVGCPSLSSIDSSGCYLLQLPQTQPLQYEVSIVSGWKWQSNGTGHHTVTQQLTPSSYALRSVVDSIDYCIWKTLRFSAVCYSVLTMLGLFHFKKY
jgi:hypothetical protein